MTLIIRTANTLDAALQATLEAGDGGAIVQRRAARIDTTRRAFFVKSLPRADQPRLEAEAEGLDALRTAIAMSGADLVVPRPLGLAVAPDRAALLLDWLELGDALDHHVWSERFGRALAQMHRHTSTRYGAFADNFIGPTPQHNPACADWPAFFAEHRLQAIARRLPTGLVDRSGLDRLCANLDRLFDQPPRAALLHGDLWIGNVGALADDRPTVFDPACYFGDPEADLAMLELFGSPGARFFSAYHEESPIDPGYSVRKRLYNLYHLLNHCLLFSGGHCARADSEIRALLAELGA